MLTHATGRVVDETENSLDIEITQADVDETVASLRPETPPNSPAHADFLGAKKIIANKASHAAALKRQCEEQIAAAKAAHLAAIDKANAEFKAEMNAVESALEYVTAIQEAMDLALGRLNKTAG